MIVCVEVAPISIVALQLLVKIVSKSDNDALIEILDVADREWIVSESDEDDALIEIFDVADRE